ncbi:MAG: stage III sporulation protein AA [Clostridium sp.]
MAEKERFIQIFSKNIRNILKQSVEDYDYVTEIRMRVNSPLFVIYKNQEYQDRYVVTREDIEETLECASHYSLYAFEEELKQGFITVSGGHRIGVAGKVVLSGGKVKTIQPAASLNIRFSHQVKGCADGIMSYLYNMESNEVYHTLFISPPCCGKTTLLRDTVRQVSDGNRQYHGRNVAVVDERSEIGACFQGIPQNDLGSRTDILDGCPKAEGMMMLIRSMSPSVVAVDEIGGTADLEALEYVMNCGCRILATVHGTSMEDIGRKPGLKLLLEEQVFERYVILSSKKGPGTVEDICDGQGRSLLCG